MKNCWLITLLLAFSLNLSATIKRDLTKDTINSKLLGSKISLDAFLKETRSYAHTENLMYKQLIDELNQYALKNKDKYLEGISQHLYGSYFENVVKMDSSFISMKKALAIQKEIKDSVGLIKTYFSFGNRYDVRGLPDSAISYYYLALDISEKLKDSINIGYSLMGLGNIISANKQPEKGKEIYRQSLKYFAATSEIAMSWIYNNIGTIYTRQDSTETAIEYFKKSLEIKEKYEDWYGIIFTQKNIGEILMDKQQKYKEALVYFKSALEIGRKQGVEREQIGLNQMKIGKAYLGMKQYDKAMAYQDSALTIALGLKSFNQIAMAYQVKGKILMGKGNYKDAYEALEKYIIYNDSLLNQESMNQINTLSAQYENEKKELEISNLEKSKKAQDAKIKQQEAETLAYSIGLSLSIILILFVSIAFLQKKKANQLIQKAKDEIEAQKNIVEEKNKEIVDSIQYAKRIQSAILPPDKLVKEYLSDSFILYKPKDIVAGDFYWMETVENKILFAAADCTGHGVPGAMVSVVCNNGLNRSVREHGLTQPGEILTKAREIVIKEFEKSDEEVKDGMDIALCCLEGNELQYAGAHNPLWIIRKGANEIEEIKANKQPIGKFYRPTPYTNHHLSLNKGDTVYIFSDGYADQFGGENGKKFKTANFRKLLLSITDKPMDEQKKLIDKNFEDWKGNLEQLDDVCVIGVRI